MVKNGWGIRDHGTLKSGASHNWFDELSRLIELFLCTESDGMVFGLTSNLLCYFDIYCVLILSIWLTIKPNNLKFILRFLKNMIKPPSLWKWSYKVSCVHLSIRLSACLSTCVCVCVCLSVCDTFFSGYAQLMFLIFLHEDILL